jgi:predicted RNA-binding Zn ribbon-like protein
MATTSPSGTGRLLTLKVSFSNANSGRVLLLYDAIRNKRRHFCGMPACGNRVQVAALFERRRKMHRYAKRIAR